MSDPTTRKLSPKQVAALAILMVQAREMSNTDLRAFGGAELVGKDRTELKGLINERKVANTYYFELSPDGWSRVPGILAQQPPGKGAAAGALAALLVGVQRAAARHRDGAKGLFGGVPAPLDMVAAVREAYEKLTTEPAGWVNLADIRDAIGGTRSDVDEALKKLAVMPGVRLIPIANLKALAPRDREAALRFGGEDNHALAIEGR